MLKILQREKNNKIMNETESSHCEKYSAKICTFNHTMPTVTTDYIKQQQQQQQ